MNNDLFDESMLDMARRKDKATDLFDEMAIYNYYEYDLKLGLQKSPLRPADDPDDNPSFSLHNRNGNIKWKDHAKGISGNIYDFVKAWYKKRFNIELNGFSEINNAIISDLHVVPGMQPYGHLNGELFFRDDEIGIRKTVTIKQKKLIKIKDIGWTSWALRYWNDRYGVSQNITDAYNIGHAKEVWVKIGDKPDFLWGVSVPDNPIFYFFFPDSGHIKCYRPFASSKKNKWIMNCSNDTDIQGYHQMNIKRTHPRLVIFTKAMKEITFLRSFHIDAIANHGENHYYSPDFIRHIKAHSDLQLSLLDNDKAGKHAAWMLRKMHNIPAFFIKEAKNITDLWEHDHRAVHKYITLLKEYGG